MHVASAIGLILLLVLPSVTALHVIRRRLRVRRVAGLFLWGVSAIHSAPRLDLSFQPGSLPRDLVAAAILAFVAGNVSLSVPSWSATADSWLNAILRVAACVAFVVIAAAGWRTPASRATARTESP